MNDKGTTLIEIVVALLILAFAFIPIIGVIGTGAKTTDVSGSYIFAKTMARNILDSVLDDVPFAAIGVASGDVSDVDGSNAEPNVGKLSDVIDPEYKVASFLALIGNSADNFARGEIVDDRGFKYEVKIFVFKVPDNSIYNVTTDMTFRYIPRPDFEKQDGWYSTTAFVPNGVSTPYDMPVPGIEIKGARELGAAAGPDGDYCVMKKILLRLKWKAKSGPERSVEVYTTKANLDKKS